MERARFTSAFTFQYSPRPGTPAAEYEDQVPKEVVQERFERLQALQELICAEENARFVGQEVELLVQEHVSKKGAEKHRLSGRARDGRLVHFDPGTGEGIRPGDFVTVTVTESKSHYLIADSGIHTHRRTKAGDHYEAGIIPTTAPNPREVGLGMPGIRAN